MSDMKKTSIRFNEPSLLGTNFEEKLKAALNQKCWIVEDGKVKECALYEFQSMIENCPRSHGIGFAYAPFNIDGDNWAVAQFNQSGSVTYYRSVFVTMEEAFDAAIDGYIGDIFSNSDLTVFSTQSAAEDFLLQENV